MQNALFMSRRGALDGTRGSIALAIGVLVVLYPTLARTAQSGDGVELVRVAVAGGVLHPTGFPLQAWLDRLAVLVPVGTAAFRIALLNLLAHAAAVFAAAEALRKIGVAFAGRAACAIAFALFPPVWALAVVPEVFSIANLVVALAVLQLAALLSRDDEEISGRDALALGALAGAAAAQHPITVEAAPLLAASALLLARDRHGRLRRLATAAGTATAIAIGAFASLPLLRGPAAWPDWGHLASASDIVRHALRREYGTLSLTGAESGPQLRAFRVFAADLARYGPLTALAAVAGAVVLFRNAARRPFALALSGTAALGIAVLFVGRMEAIPPAVGYLSKLDGPLVLALALFAGAGVDAVAGALRRPLARAGLGAAIAALAAAAFLAGRPYADAAGDDTLEVLGRGLGATLPANAVYLADGDIESFLGARSPGDVRYPVVAGLLPQRWYVRDVLPVIEPRLRVRLDRRDPLPTAGGIAREAIAHGTPVASTDRALAAASGVAPTLAGLFFVARPGSEAERGAGAVAGALALCPSARELPSLPSQGHVFSRNAFRLYARAYGAAAQVLEERGATAAAAAARSAQHALQDGRDPRAWRAACDALESSAPPATDDR